MATQAELDRAVAIIEAGMKSYNGDPPVWEGPVPEDEKEILSGAEELAEMARAARSSGVNTEAVTQVLFAADVSGEADGKQKRQKKQEVADSMQKSGQVAIRIKSGKEIRVDKAKAEKLIASGNAVLVEEEKAEAPEAENDWPEDMARIRLNSTGAILMVDSEEAEALVDVEEASYVPFWPSDLASESPGEIAEAEIVDEGEEVPEAEVDGEPWEGYDDAKLKEIYAELDKNPSWIDVVERYETANKNRTYLLKKIQKMREEAGGEAESQTEEVESQERPSDDAEGYADAEVDEGPEDRQPSPEVPTEAQENILNPPYHDLIKSILETQKLERLSLPRQLPEDIVEMPFDVSQLDHSEIRSLHSRFNAYAARSHHVLMLQEAYARACRRIADEKVRNIIKGTNGDKITFKKEQAETQAEVKTWRDRQHAHEDVEELMRRERDLYREHVTVLSRESSMRQFEVEHLGGGHGSSKSRG